MLTPEQIKTLNAPLNPDLVATREGGGKKLSYIEAYVAIKHLNAIFGYGNWQRNAPVFQNVVNDEAAMKAAYTCSLSITVFHPDLLDGSGNRLVICETWGTGYGDAKNSANFGQAHEGAIKEAESDAMKRALIAFGSQFGLSLYDKQQREVGFSPDQPDTYNQADVVVTESDVVAFLNTITHPKKNQAAKDFVKARHQSLGKAKLAEYDSDQLKSLLTDLKPFR